MTTPAITGQLVADHVVQLVRRSYSEPVSEPAAEMPISEARDHLGELVGRARYGGAETILTHYGSPAAVVISFEEYQRLKGTDVLRLPPEIEHVVEEGRRHPERDQPRPRRTRSRAS